MDQKDFKRCVENLTKVFSLPFTASTVCRTWGEYPANALFIDLHVASSCSFDDFEITNQKTYRQLRTLVKHRLIMAVLDQRELVDEALKKLGYRGE